MDFVVLGMQKKNFTCFNALVEKKSHLKLCEKPKADCSVKCGWFQTA